MQSVCIVYILRRLLFIFFFFNDTATTEIYTLSLHDALPIFHPTRQNDGLYRLLGSRKKARIKKWKFWSRFGSYRWKMVRNGIQYEKRNRKLCCSDWRVTIRSYRDCECSWRCS